MSAINLMKISFFENVVTYYNFFIIVILNCIIHVHINFMYVHYVCHRLYQLSKEDKLPMSAINIHDSVVKVSIYI